MPVSNYLRKKLLEHSLGVAAYTMPATVYLAAYTTDPTVADTGSEVAGNGYARQAIQFNAEGGGQCANTSLISFPKATANWGTITHYGIRDALTAGNLLWPGRFEKDDVGNPGQKIATPKVIETDDTLVADAGIVTVKLT